MTPRKTGAPRRRKVAIKRPKSNPLSILELCGKNISIFAPTEELWAKLNEIVRASKDAGGTDRQTAWFKFGNSVGPLDIHVLNAVFTECTDTPLEGRPADLVRITVAVLATWDTAHFLEGYWCGFVLEQARAFARAIDRKTAIWRLALDRHPGLAKKFQELGAAAKRAHPPASDTHGVKPDVTHPSLVDLIGLEAALAMTRAAIGTNVTHDSAPQGTVGANTRANTARKKVSLVPENPEIIELMRYIDRNGGDGVIERQLARDAFPKKTEKQRASMLAQVRRFRRKHKEA